MKSRVIRALLGAAITLAVGSVTALPAAAATSGSFTGTITQALLPRNPDGSCAVGRASLHEEDKVTFSGTLSF
ncbi:MAG: hypothetical protein JOY61_06885 [Chloroflexi bacterium]|nr:hypothetical protein [Chloroflexota bacterium]